MDKQGLGASCYHLQLKANKREHLFTQCVIEPWNLLLRGGVETKAQKILEEENEAKPASDSRPSDDSPSSAGARLQAPEGWQRRLALTVSDGLRALPAPRNGPAARQRCPLFPLLTLPQQPCL